MRFKCGKTQDELDAEWEWHDWFAWRPVSIEPGKCVWLEIIQRRIRYFESKYDYREWTDTEYRFKE